MTHPLCLPDVQKYEHGQEYEGRESAACMCGCRVHVWLPLGGCGAARLPRCPWLVLAFLLLIWLLLWGFSLQITTTSSIR